MPLAHGSVLARRIPWSFCLREPICSGAYSWPSAWRRTSGRTYLKSGSSLLGLPCRITLEKTRFRYEIPEKQVNVAKEYKSLACAFELHALFMLYLTHAEVYLLPKRALTDEQNAFLRARLKDTLKDRFATRFS